MSHRRTSQQASAVPWLRASVVLWFSKRGRSWVGHNCRHKQEGSGLSASCRVNCEFRIPGPDMRDRISQTPFEIYDPSEQLRIRSHLINARPAFFSLSSSGLVIAHIFPWYYLRPFWMKGRTISQAPVCGRQRRQSYQPRATPWVLGV